MAAALYAGERGWWVPVPRQQCVQFVGLGSPGDDPLQDVGEIVERLDTVELAAVDQGIGDRPTASTGIRSGEQPVLAAQGQLGVILPMSGRKWLSIIVGIRFTAVGSGGNTANIVRMVTSFMSRPRRAWSSLSRHGCWIRSLASGWRSGLLTLRPPRWPICTIC